MAVPNTTPYLRALIRFNEANTTLNLYRLSFKLCYRQLLCFWTAPAKTEACDTCYPQAFSDSFFSLSLTISCVLLSSTCLPYFVVCICWSVVFCFWKRVGSCGCSFLRARPLTSHKLVGVTLNAPRIVFVHLSRLTHSMRAFDVGPLFSQTKIEYLLIAFHRPS